MHEAGISDRYRLYGQGAFSSLGEAFEGLEAAPRREDIDDEAEGHAFAADLRQWAQELRAQVDPTWPSHEQWRILVRAEEMEDRAGRYERGED